MWSPQRTLISAMTTGRPSSRRYSIKFAFAMVLLAPECRRARCREALSVGLVEPYDLACPPPTAAVVPGHGGPIQNQLVRTLRGDRIVHEDKAALSVIDLIERKPLRLDTQGVVLVQDVTERRPRVSALSHGTIV